MKHASLQILLYISSSIRLFKRYFQYIREAARIPRWISLTGIIINKSKHMIYKFIWYPQYMEITHYDVNIWAAPWENQQSA